jgi:YHS domain-containing protein
MSFRLFASVAIASIACLSSAGFAEEAAFKGDPYTLTTDPVSGETLPAKPIVARGPNGEVRFANEKNAVAFKADPAKYQPAIDAAVVKQQADHYPLEVCPISGEKLGGMGEPVTVVVDNRLVKLCCKGCVEEAKKDPAKAFKKLDEAVIAKQKPTYPLDKCLISGEKLGGDAIDKVIGVRLVRLCCADCVEEVEKQPLKWLAKLDEAKK